MKPPRLVTHNDGDLLKRDVVPWPDYTREPKHWLPFPGDCVAWLPRWGAMGAQVILPNQTVGIVVCVDPVDRTFTVMWAW